MFKVTRCKDVGTQQCNIIVVQMHNIAAIHIVEKRIAQRRNVRNVALWHNCIATMQTM